ncbi:MULTISPECIES: sigma-54 interaction domain-containing protein [Heyndrickxia]|uniref:sigma-54 interaction domain-containing protein n=1 Tax=Heyndrickxia TaxID=2837504 RepID=UPI002DBC564A|nr:sigma 54-interacting transcriptional regulator [Weizmannia sp. CD-2023]MEC2222931.1 sigma 54-interacting transcriptional regulator [Weizmannia sp. CD-2023]
MPYTEFEQSLNEAFFFATPGFVEIKEKDALLQCEGLDQAYIKEMFKSGVRMDAGREEAEAVCYFPIVQEMKVVSVLLLRPKQGEKERFARDIQYLKLLSELACQWVAEKLERETWQKRFGEIHLETRKLIQSITEPFCLVDQDGLIQEMNEHMASLFRKRRTTLMGEKIMQYITKEKWESIKSRNEKDEMVVQVPGNQGEAYFATIQPVKSKQGIVSYMILLKSKKTEKPEQAGRRLYHFEDILGVSEILKQTIQSAKRVSKSDVTIMLRGESGTGKEMFAQAIHHESERKNQPFVALNCAAIPENLLESELFGYEKGAFTGAEKEKPGRFELANHGTLFLDEIGDMSLYLQAKILRVLQEKTLERIGSNKSRKIDVRIITATHRNLEELIRKGEFREDLYYRISVIPIYIPPLRARKEDLPILIEHFIQNFSKDLNMDPKNIAAETLDRLMQYDWPGNIRELQNVVRHFVELQIGDTVTLESLPSSLQRGTKSLPPFVKPKRTNHYQTRLEKRKVLELLERNGWSTEGKKKTAADLGISLATLYRYLKKIQG